MDPITSINTTYNWHGNERIATSYVKLDYEKGNSVIRTIQRVQNIEYDTYNKIGKQVPNTNLGSNVDKIA